MSIIQWDDSFSVGSDVIDSQHQRWIQMINNLDDVLCDGDPDKLMHIKQASLDAMIDYAGFHFSFEEQLMEKMCCPNLTEHKAAHEQFRNNLKQIQDDVKSGFQPLNTQLMSIMMNWLKEHILNVDKQCGLGATGNNAHP